MAWDEAKAWKRGKRTRSCTRRCSTMRRMQPARNARRKKIVQPEDMPWEMSRQGLLKHLLNEQMNTRMETVDAYMQIIPPGSRSGQAPASCRGTRPEAGRADLQRRHPQMAAAIAERRQRREGA